MTSRHRRHMVAVGLAALAFGGAAHAQDGPLTEEAVTGYVEQIVQDAVSMMETQDHAAISKWIDLNIAADAAFQVSASLRRQDRPMGFVSLHLTGEDLRSFGRVFAGAFGQAGISDYSLRAEVTKVTPHGTDAATAAVQWTETFSIRPEGSTESSQTQSGSGISVQAVADCHHLIQRERDRMVIGLSSCVAEMAY